MVEMDLAVSVMYCFFVRDKVREERNRKRKRREGEMQSQEGRGI